MQIALTKKLAEAMGLTPAPADGASPPLFTWTANWTTVWENRRAEDMLVLVNHATRFAVAVYQVKRKDMKKVGPQMMTAAIRNTLLALNLNAEIVDEYLAAAGEVRFAANKDRQMTAVVNRTCLNCSYRVAQKYAHTPKVFDDTIGALANFHAVGGTASSGDGFKPRDAMFAALSERTGKPAYKYRAFELLATLDLDVYTAARRLIVPANITFPRLHDVLQRAFHWKNSHMHGFTVFDGHGAPVAEVVMDEETLEYAENGVLETGRALSDCFPQYRHMLYTYDMGDNWEHEIKLVRVIEEHDADSPWLLEAAGQAPPEDVGGVGGFVEFREIMLNPGHEDYKDTKNGRAIGSRNFPSMRRRPACYTYKLT